MNTTERMKPLDIAILTDTHYYSKKNWVDGDPFAFPPAREQLFRRGSEEIVRHVLDSLCAPDSPQIILISGDLTNNGEKTSHEEFREILRKVKARGKRIYVTTATHDYRIEGVSYGFDRNNRKVDVPAFVRNDLRGFYREFGPDEAVSIHEPSMSYAVDLTPEYRLLALNDDKGYDHAGFTEGCFAWIEAQIRDAREKEMFVFGMTHHPVLAPSPLYRLIAPHDLLEDGERRARQFADLGVPFLLTGHSHIHNITGIRTAKGNRFYAVSTSSLVGYPPNYRLLHLDPQSGVVHIRTETVDSVPGLDTKGLSLAAFTRRQFLGVVEDVLTTGERDYEAFISLADGFSIREEKARRLRPIIQPVCRALNHLTFGKIVRFVGRRRCGISASELDSVRQNRVVPFVTQVISNLFCGDASVPKDSVEYRIADAFLQKLDSLAKPFRSKLSRAGIESLHAAVLPLLHNDGLPDADYTIRL